jgi:amino acid adenylation domain-containing protein
LSGDRDGRGSRFQLSTDRLALLRALRSEKGLGADTRETIPRREESATYPLSFGQERLWFLDRLNPGAAAYNLRAAVRLDGALDTAALDRALRALVARQAALATVFTTVEQEDGDETPVQRIAPHLVAQIGAPMLADLSALAPERREATLRRLAAREAAYPFELEKGPLLRASRVRLTADSQALVMVVHHIAADGWSMDLLVRELSALYRAELMGAPARPAQIPTLPIRYVDYAAWQRERAASGALDAELASWRERLSGAPLVLDLPTDRPRPAVPSFRGALASTAFPVLLAGELGALARRAEATPFMLLLALFGLTLRRHADPGGALADVLLGTPIANRQRAEVANLIGFFANTLVMRVALAGDPTFAELLRRVRAASLAAQAQQDLPFERLVEALHPERTLDRTPIFQAMLVVDHAGGSGASSAASSGGALALAPLEVPGGSARFELTLVAAVGEGAWRLALEYAADLFDGTTARRWLGRFAALAEAAVATPEAPVSRLAVLPASERHQTLLEWNAGPWAEGLPAEEPRLDRLFAATVAAGPERLAVSCAGTVWTYAELAAHADRVRRLLAARCDFSPERTVALALRRSPNLIAAILGTLAADAAYLPLDPEAPDERLAWTIDDAQAALVLVDEENRERFVALLGAERVLVLSEEGCGSELPDRPSGRVSDRLAYVIYTSGSTGKPKGVMVSHRAACATLLWRLAQFAPGPGDVVLQNISTTFDPSVWQIFGALLSGARLALLPPNERQDFAAFARRLAAERGTITDLAPSMLRAFLDQDGLDDCRDLRLLFAGGEALPPDLAARFKERFPAAALQNIYGPTEVAIDAATWTFAPRPGATAVPIGRPAAGKRLFVLDGRLQPVPIGVPGELYVGCLPATSGGGGGLARGYLGSPDLTAERFGPNSFAGLRPEDDVPGSRLYRTGDLVRLLADGAVEFLGRVDRQVKVRGFRIELGEVEAAIVRHGQVREAYAAARERGGETELVAWFAPDWPGAAADVRAALAADLPAHLVPAALGALAELPRNASGKVDVGALPELSAEGSQGGDSRPFRPPGRGLESAIAEIWREVLGREQVGGDDNFFDLGGHSLLLVRVHGRLKKLLGREVPIVDLFAHPTVSSLAAYLSPPDERSERTAVGAPTRRPARAATTDHAIAIVAVAGRFPGARDVEELWRNLLDGRDSIRHFSAEELLAAGHSRALLDRPEYVRARGALADVDLFDAGFFGIGAREAELLDPQNRLFLEVAWEALERAGRDPGRGGPIGVFAGTSVSTYLLKNVLANPEVLRGGGLAQAHLGTDKDFLATRASYLLDLKGPSLAVQTACSTSLVAVHLACRSLRDGECDLALAGGVSIAVPQVEGYVYQEGGITSPDGLCRPFDAAAAGTVSGSGVGFVVLARLADALENGDRIVAVIRGSAINNDGAAKVGYTAPGIEGQSTAIAAALADSGVEPSEIGYVEAHGTATPLGDPIEIAALGRAFGSFDGEIAPGSIPIGSIKSNIGHLDAAAGVVGLIKAALALEREEIPPSLHYTAPNPRIDWAATPFRVAAERTAWPRGERARFAGVSSFGIGGTNVHVVLEEAPVREAPVAVPERPAQLLVWSAKSDAALDTLTGRLAAQLTAEPFLDLAAVSHTLAAGRKRFARRAALVAKDRADAAAVLAARDPERLMFGVGGDEIHRSVAFLLPGQGAQRFAMGAGLYDAEPVFRAAFDECAAAIDPHLETPAGLVAALGLTPAAGGSPTDAVRDAANDEVRDTALAQPALFALEVALARLWESWGVRPSALLGHSIGEYAAAHLAGVFTLEDAGRVVALRGRLMSGLPSGAMLAVPLGEEATRALLAGTDLDLAAVNGPELSVVSGDENEIAVFALRLADQGLEGRRLRTSHAFHSRAMEPVLAPFAEILGSIELSPPRLPFLSNLTGDWISPAEATDPGYWVRHLRQPVRFGAGLTALLAEGNLALLEVGPGRALSGLARRQTTATTPIIASLGESEGGATGEPAALRGALGRLWLAGVDVTAEAAAGPSRGKVLLPTYPFERRRYWIDPAPAAIWVARRNLDRLPASDWYTTPVWREIPASWGENRPDSARDWLIVEDRHGLGERLADRLRSCGDQVIQIGETERLDALDRLPARVVHLANLTNDADETVEAALDRSFHDLASLARIYGERGRPLDLAVVADGLCDVAGEARIQPVKSALLGVVRALPLEVPGIACRAVDVPAHDLDRLAVSLLAELDRGVAGNSDPDLDLSLVALRGGRRFVRAFVKLPDAPGETLRAGGVVLVTGGTSGLGLEIASHLARTRGAKLVLVGRTARSPRLEGAEVLTLGADVADPEAMRWVVERTIERFGALHGVVHAAGIAGGGVVQLRERAAAAAVLSPKVQGTLALAAAVASLPPLDLFVVCSSLAALFGGAGQSDYAAANAVLDSFAESERAAGRRVLAIDWDAWSEVGMAARSIDPKKAPREVEGLAISEGLAAFDRAVASGQARVVVSTRDLGALRARFRPAPDLAAAPSETPSRPKAAMHERPAIATAYLAPRDATERALAAVWQEVLGVGPIGVHDDFTELGGHSLLALQVVARIRRDLSAELPLAALFEAPTIARLTLRIAPMETVGLATAPSPESGDEAGDFPLSFAQERLWFLDRLEPGRAAYNLPGAVRLAGALAEPALAATLAELARRHAVLRTTFPSVGGKPVQRVASPAALPLPCVDLSALSPGLAAALARAQSVSFGRRPFDLARGPVFRALLLRISGVERILAFALHHIVSDGSSMRVIQHEVGRLYAAFVRGLPSPLPPLPLSYGEYARRERSEMAEGGQLAAQLQNRTARLSPLPEPLDLPADRARPGVQTFRGALEPLQIPPALSLAVRAVARRAGATPFMALLAVLATLIRRLTGRTDFALGTPIANRDRVETEGMIGLFVNTIVLRLDLMRDPSFDELLARVREESVAAFASAALPFERLITALSPERDLSRSPLFQILFAFQGAGGESAEVEPASSAALAAEPLALDAGRAMFDLTLTLDDAGTRFHGGLEYATDLFDRTRIRRTADQLLRLLEAVVAEKAEGSEPARRLSDLALLSAPERHQLLIEWEGEGGEGGAGSMQERFFRQAEKVPEADAVVWGSERWSYADLARRARVIAERLRADYAVGPESVVGISARRTPHLIAGLLGILEAGAAYLPLDPSYPDERLAFMLADAQARAAMVDGATSARLAMLAPNLGWLDLEAIGPEPALPRVAVDPGQLAYLIYTSGSTGRPKGVAIEHRSAGALLDWAGRTFAAADLSGVLAATSIAFDLSVFEIFVPLSFGGAVILAEDALALRDLPAFAEVTLVNTVPSALAELVRGGAPPSLSVVCVAGEPLPRSLVDAVHGRWGCDNVWNLYGPSEDTTYSTGVRVPASQTPPTIGRPLAGSRARIVDDLGVPLPMGVPGELVLAGAGLSRGYYGRPELTAERFVPDPFGEKGARLYRTGDLARFRADGELEYLGRIDGQVKIRGFRIELGEVEEALRSLPGIAEAAVLATPDRTRLVAFVVGEQPPADSAFDEWRRALGRRLPGHFVPSLWRSLAALPRTINGKVDHRALSGLAAERPSASGPATEGETALDPLQELVANVWARVLELPAERPIGPNDDFFALGGHSLLAAQILARLADACGVELPVRALFEAPTVAGLAARIEAAGREGEGVPPLPPIARLARGADFRPPLSFGQLRLWFLDRLETDPAGRAAYNLPAALRLEGPLVPPALAAALSEVVRRHEALRTSFAIEGEEPFQAVADPAPVRLPLCDFSGLAFEAASRASRRIADAEVRRPFDLSNPSQGPLLRALLIVRSAEGSHAHDLILTLHHAASDGTSMSVLQRELPLLYAAAAAGRPSPLPELPIQYADYAAWQRGLLAGAALDREVDWWRTLLLSAPPRLDLPTDHPRPRIQTFRGDQRSRSLARPEVLRGLARDLGATPYMVALAAWGALLGRASGQGVVVVGSPIANRPRPELERLIGFFANTLALPVDLAGDPPFSGLVERVRAASLGAFAHSAVPFEKLVEQLAPARDLSSSPLFQTLLSFQAGAPPRLGQDVLPEAAETLRIAPIAAEVGSAKFDLTLALQTFGAATFATIEWNADLFDPATAIRLLDRFERLLAAAADKRESLVSRIDLLAPAERHQVLIETNDMGRPARDSWSILAEIAATAAAKPEGLAIHANGEHLTYGELIRRARRLGERLRRDFSVTDESVVAISLPRTPVQLVGLLAILDSGAAYLPLDPTTPAERLAFLLADARAKVLVTETGFLSAPEGTRVLPLDREEWTDEPERSSPDAFLAERIAYVLYTSGSTGVPKGVAVEQRSLANLLATIAERPGLSEHDVLLGVTGLWFDIASVEMLLPLVVGARLELVERAEAADGGRLLARLLECGATVMQATPGTWRILIDAGWPGGNAAPLDVRSTGEALPPALAAELLGRSEKVWNLYGPTETTIYSSLARVRSSAVTIGRPVGNTELVVAETGAGLGAWFGEPAPPGALGELLIGGSGVARGYLGRPDLTAERFVPDPFSGRAGARFYRSGDRVRALPGGELLYLGRGDFQVKVRGFRIELAEIEAALETHPQVAEAVVVARSAPRDAQQGREDGDLRLVAYVVAASGEPGTEALRDHLRGKLPSHMVPWAFVPLAALPRNRNGKVDRGALPAPERAAWSGGVTFEEPRTETERRIAAIWSAALGLERVGVDDNFFDSGGHSLLAVRVHQRLRAELKREFPLVGLFAHPTVRSLARYLAPAVPGVSGPAVEGDSSLKGEAATRGRDRGAERRQAAARRRGGRGGQKEQSEQGGQDGAESNELEPGIERNR